MPNPPFQPLTLLVEEWRRINEDATPTTGTRVYRGCDTQQARQLIAECEAQAQEAASLRQQLKSQVGALRQLLSEAEARASQAEAALEEMQKLIDRLKRGDNCWCEVGIGNPMMRGEHSAVCWELQRRRSAPGQETA